MNKLKEACNLSLDRWVDSLPENPPQHKFSRKHEKKIEKLFDKMRNDKYHKLTRRAVKLIIIAAIILSMTLTAFAFPQTRDYLIERFTGHSVYKIPTGNPARIETYPELKYIPKGFEIKDEYKNKYMCTYDYVNEDKWFGFEMIPSSMRYTFDTENFDTTEFEHNGTKYVHYKSDSKTNGYIWNRKDYVYRIYGNIDENELLKIAENAV